ncbi:putative molybdopterin biosynthesis protein [Paenibacillus sophorae]|uniref:Helix-turn-helix transcriptional regulator n=1 Tax=Paenibacillus sophorae TaxID=1333845 RepID=A0A1H8TB13_9BACL|nr:helix-turn-helix transcriptional regulator [Paenibacillus sophorae]QWU17170.1 helix-turn-helix transcriptional regulator [Paenibacillus sophorae]SEO87936.1 putative molybdopterin biosynthesis protein [Paenibacillus sophorae]
MSDNTSYTTEEVAQLLKISKLKVYDLIKKGELSSYRVGKQMRVDSSDLEQYKQQSRESGRQASMLTSTKPGLHGISSTPNIPPPATFRSSAREIVITGQDISLDILAQHLEKFSPSLRPLRSYAGSLDSLISMYRGESDIVSTHLLDGDSGEYNIPYIRKMLVGTSYLVVRLLGRAAGLYVQKGNPKGLQSWKDLGQSGLRLVNRERGSGARVLLDEQLRLNGVKAQNIEGYATEEISHVTVAGRIARGEADVGVGNEKASRIVEGVDFIPLIQEKYDLVMLKRPDNQDWISAVLEICRSQALHNELNSLYGYDLSETGKIIYET